MTTPTIRLSTPPEIAASIPLLCGFRPAHSLFLLALDGNRVGLCVRLDLPAPGTGYNLGDTVILLDRLRQVNASSIVAAVYTDDVPGYQPMVDFFTSAVEVAGIEVRECFAVKGDRLFSYTCDGPCCPAEGLQIPASTPAVTAIAAEKAGAGRAMMESREDVVRSLEPSYEAVYAVKQFLRTTAPAADLDTVLDPKHELTYAEAAALLQQMGQTCGRDTLIARLSERDEGQVLALLRRLLPMTPAENAAAPTLLAIFAYLSGDGGLANVALDRAMRADDTFSLALLLRQMLDMGVHPDDLRGSLADLRRLL